MKLSASLTGLDAALKTAEIIESMRRMKAMRQASGGLKQDLCDRVVAAGLSERLARTWQDKVYPSTGNSLEPAALVYSKAPGIIQAFARGTTIVATAGRRLLALPTDDTPKKRNGSSMSPVEVESKFGKRLRFVPAGSAQGSKLGKAAGFLVIDGVVAKKSNGRPRNASARELAGGRRDRVRPVEFAVMFVLLASVKIPKKLDLDAALKRARTDLEHLLAEG